MKTYREGKGIVPLILNIDTAWRPLYPLGKNPDTQCTIGYGVDLGASVGT